MDIPGPATAAREMTIGYASRERWIEQIVFM
jgi:hypothetical protein